MEEAPKKPTKKQLRLLKFIQDFTCDNGYSPSYREIMNALELKSVSAVAEHVSNCEKAGFIKKVPNAARSLEVIPPENHEEAQPLFRKTLAELTEKLNNAKTDDERASIRDDISTLRAAAKLLKLDF